MAEAPPGNVNLPLLVPPGPPGGEDNDNDELQATLSTADTTVPTDPIMGKFIEQNPPGSGKWNARMGGKPRADWSGLATEQLLQSTPYHYRRAQITDDIKGYNIRTQGLTTKFKADGDILQFQNQVWKHLWAHGLDTISYLQDPTDSNVVIDVVRNHARFSANLKETKLLAELFLNKFDEYDKSNNAAATVFLLDSLDVTLCQSLERKMKDNETFAMTWLKLIQLVVAPSLDRWDILNEKIKSSTPMQFEGQNVRELCDKFEDLASTLRAGGQYNHALTRTMIKNVLKSKDLPAPYTLQLSTLLLKVDEALSSSVYMSPSARWEHMEDEELTYEDVCEIMASGYDVLVVNGEWPAAKLPQDTTSVPSQFANLTHHIKTLMQNSNNGNGKRKDSKDVTCYKCGQKGHYANRCPDRSGGGKQVKARSWKFTPPGEGEAMTKKVKENVFNWCAKCKRWTTTHTTITHTSGKKNEGGKQAHASLLELDPSAWCLSTEVDRGIVTRSTKARTQMIAEVIGMELNPEGDVMDHLKSLEFKV